MVRECIERHISTEQFAALQAAEESERELLRGWAYNVRRGRQP
jgi:hypothetical protein